MLSKFQILQYTLSEVVCLLTSQLNKKGKKKKERIKKENEEMISGKFGNV